MSVTVVNPTPGGGASNAQTFTVTESASPAAPSNLSAALSGTGTLQRIKLTWTDNSSNEAKFVIERSTSPDFSSNRLSFEVTANTTSYKDTTNIQAGTTYYYRVYAVGASGMRSAPSNVASTATK